jgi:CheY-like chemotaxis protein
MHDFLLDLENMMQMQARKNNLALVFERDTDIPDFVELDFNKLRQILINLIGNSIKYTEKGNIWVYIRKMEHHIIFEVRDTGPGIEPEQISKIFDAFHQVNGNNFSKGTGLGLTISMKLAQLMGGEIHVESTVGQGSTFTLQVPVKVVQQEHILVLDRKSVRIKSLQAHEKPPKIMIVDDVDENRIILTEFLTQVGFDCHDFSMAKPALDALDGLQPDIILSDIIMPEMNGKEFLVEIRKHKHLAKTPVIAITASIFAETRTDLLQFGFDEFIHKPIEMHQLLDIISKFTQVNYEEEESQKAMIQSHSSQIHTHELDDLSSAQKKHLTEALELLDVDSIEEVVKSLPEHLILKKQLQLALEEKNYRFILSLSDQLNS